MAVPNANAERAPPPPPGGRRAAWFCCLVEVVSSPAPPGHRAGRRSAIILSRDPATLATALNSKAPLTRSDYEDLSGAIRRLVTLARKSKVAKAGEDTSANHRQEEDEDEAKDDEDEGREDEDRELAPPPTYSASLGERYDPTGAAPPVPIDPQEERLRLVLEQASNQLSACVLPELFSPHAPADWIARSEAAISSQDACALSREIELGYVTIQEAARRLDQLRRILLENARATGNASARASAASEWLAPIDDYRRANEMERKKRRAPSVATLVAPRRPNESLGSPPLAKRRPRAAPEGEPEPLSPSASLLSQDSNASETFAPPSSGIASPPKCAHRLAMVIGPLQSYERARTVGLLWGLQSQVMVSRAAFGELLAYHYSLLVHADLGVVFRAERLQHHVLRQTPSGELWMLARKDAQQQQRTSLFDCITSGGVSAT